MNPPFAFAGEALSLLSAIVWALAVILFRKSGERVHPLALNTFKNLVATLLFLPTMLILGEPLLRQAPTQTYLLLLLSGALGIGIGDTLLFMSLNRIGAGLTGIVVCMYSPFVIALSFWLLGERLTVLQGIGALLIIMAILIATIEKKKSSVPPLNIAIGTVLGIAASAAMAIGIVMIKRILETSPLLWTTQIRLFGGIFILFCILLLYPRRHDIYRSLVTTRKWTYTISGSVIGAYMAMIIWLGGMKYTQAAVASALNQTSTIFIIILAAAVLKEPLTIRRIIGIVLAFAGTLLVSFG
ncbi:MAG: DMT family transporter [candidate division WOR-3 bacterium]|nr:MAG: DMT family transporter [candidate division WOR-3 bacterium]